MVSKLSFVVVLAMVCSYSCEFPREKRGFFLVQVGADKLALAYQPGIEARAAFNPKPLFEALTVLNPQQLLDARAAPNPKQIFEAALYLDRAKAIRTGEDFDEDEESKDHVADAEVEYRRWGGHRHHGGYYHHRRPWY